MSHELNNNPINFVENNTTVNLKQQYNTLKLKIEDLEKNNKEMLEMYKSEEQRLIKSNEFLMQKNNPNNSKNIKELEAEVLKMRNDIKELQNLMEPRNGINLIENDNASSKSINNKIDGATEEKIREEYLINYKNKLKTEFEKKLISKHQELIDYYTEQNKKIIENNLPKENLVDIDEIKFFSIKNNLNEQSSLSDEENFDINKINLILSLFCLKEEYPKEFFIDYILDETYTERGANKTKNKKRTSLANKDKKPSARNLKYEMEEFNSNFLNKIAEKICQLFDIKNKDDIDVIKLYINEIIKIDNNIRNYLEKNLNKYRFAPFESFEKEKYDEKIKTCFEKNKEEIENLLKMDDNIISLQIFEEFLDKGLNEDDKDNEFIFYVLSLMKLSKNERKEEKNERLKTLRLFEFNLSPFYQKIFN